MGAGLVPVPVLDLAAVSGVQLKMISEISKIYGVPFHESRGKAAIGALIGFALPHVFTVGLLGSAVKALPLVGALAGAPTMALLSGAAAYALGKVFIQHFESGGTFLNFKPEDVQEYFKAQFEEGRKVAAAMDADKKAEGPA
jgi:uncharacterized protein (DUF697 family)